MDSKFEAVIGLEVHCQLATESKIFCGCRARLGEGQSVSEIPCNFNTCPICAGHPGALPKLNQKVLEFATIAGLATNCQINSRSQFARKNYFYPDLPKGYQISQYEHPLCHHGWLLIDTTAGPKKVRINRIHIEEDAGKNQHFDDYSLVNLNRAGVPLIEIVSEPDLRSSEEAGNYLRTLYTLVTYLEICDGNLEEGNFRCDANVSVRPVGSETLGTRTEIKNVNSFRFVEKAIEYEISRQIDVIRAGGAVKQETRGYDSDHNRTFSMRSKEEAYDYRYFPDPDLVAVKLNSDWISRFKESLPELPGQKKDRFVSEWGLNPSEAGLIAGSKFLVKFFENVIHLLNKRGYAFKAVAKPTANWISGEVMRLMNESGQEVSQSKLTEAHFADLIDLIQKGMISGSGGKQVLELVWTTGEPVAAVVEEKGLKQVSDTSQLEPIIDQVVIEFKTQVADYRAGRVKILGFLVGQVMKQSGGRANPALVGELLKRKL